MTEHKTLAVEELLPASEEDDVVVLGSPLYPSPLAQYRLLGASGLRVSPMCLGTMTFGTRWKHTTGEITREEVEKIFDYYVSLGGNFIDASNRYHDGQTEEWIGEIIEARGIRDDLVISTKVGLPLKNNVINSAGNHRKSLVAAVEDSLRRLRTSYIDILYIRIWDFTTPIYEVMRALNDLVSQGKVLYLGVCDTPAYIVSACNTLAQNRGWAHFAAYCGPYNILTRSMEYEIFPMCRDFGIGLCLWGSLGSGKLCASANKDGLPTRLNGGRCDAVVIHDGERRALEEVQRIADEIGVTTAEVAVSFVLQNPSTTSVIIGVRSLMQLEANIQGFSVELTEEQYQKLLSISSDTPQFPQSFIRGSDYQSIPFLEEAGFIA